MSCAPERITGFVDGALESAERLELAAHLEGCAACQAQVAFETALRRALRDLPALEPSAGLEERIRRALAGRRRVVPWTLSAAAALVLALVWSASTTPVLAGQLVKDHANCQSVRSLGLGEDGDPQVQPSITGEAAALRSMPREVGGLTLSAASICDLGNGVLVLHLQYLGQHRRVSLFVVPAVHLPRSYSGRVGGSEVRLLSSRGRVLGLVGEDGGDLESFVRALAA